MYQFIFKWKRWVGKQVYFQKVRWRHFLLRRNIVRHYSKFIPVDPELAQVARSVKQRGAVVFPSLPKERRRRPEIEVYTDPESNCRFVCHEGKRLFFPRTWNDQHIRHVYAQLLREQDVRSPHRYLTPEFDVTPQTHLFDIGAAEGILALSVVERVAAVHLFEAQEQWLEPLQRTFAPWPEKVHIVPKYVSDVDDSQNITLDTYVRGMEAADVLLKLDVEGAEAQVLAGGERLLSRSGVRAVVSTYHRAGDFDALSAGMSGRGFSVTPSSGYMLFLHDPEGLRAPWFRRGVIYCRKMN
jgi:hypothetical protein